MLVSSAPIFDLFKSLGKEGEVPLSLFPESLETLLKAYINILQIMLFCSLVFAYECMAHVIHKCHIFMIFYGRPIRPLFIRTVECCSCFLVMPPCISRCLLENRFVQPLLFSRPLLLAMGVANSVSHSSQKCDLLSVNAMDSTNIWLSPRLTLCIQISNERCSACLGFKLLLPGCRWFP